MKKYWLFTFWLAFVLFLSTSARGQMNPQEDLYVKYDEYYRELGNQLRSGKQDSIHKTLKEITDIAALLKDDQAPSEAVNTVNANNKKLSDEKIFATRKNSVFIVGKLTSANPSQPGLLNFDLIGTAFAITADGICVTNYHVLKNILQPAEAATSRDSLYFIITPDKKVYWLDKLLAFSQNNDLAVFTVRTQGKRFDPIPLGKPANIGAAVYCISHPLGHFYYFSKGMVARNVAMDPLDLRSQYNKKGYAPIRMEVTADYAVGSSGGPILDSSGNVIGVVVSTIPLSWSGKDDSGKEIGYIQMMIKDTSPVKALTQLLGKKMSVSR